MCAITCIPRPLTRFLPFLAVGKKTIFVTGFDESVKEQELLQAFVTFGTHDIRCGHAE